MNHVIVAATQDRARNYCDKAGLPRPGARSDGERSYVLTPSTVKAIRGLGAPLTIHEVDSMAWASRAMKHELDVLRMVASRTS